MARFQIVQKAVARFRRREHITPILIALNWVPVHYRIELKILLFVFKSLNGLAPSHLSELLNLNTPVRCLRFTSGNILSQPRSKLKSRGDREFAVIGPRLWNNLPLSLRSLSSVHEFKVNLKSYLFTPTFNSS